MKRRSMIKQLLTCLLILFIAAPPTELRGSMPVDRLDLCLARDSETFMVAVSGAPVTAWDGYDTHYTERYMGTPQSNPDGYRDGSVMAHVEQISGRLMLVQGLIDENVHFRHTARLINALIQARKTYDLLLFPDERHLPRRLADRIFMEEQIRDFFLKYLL